MTDEHAKLTAEYERLVKELDGVDVQSPTFVSVDLIAVAVLHILKRLGPPSADDAVNVDELKAALEAQTSGGA